MHVLTCTYVGYFVFAEEEILAEKEKLYEALEYSSNSKAAAYPEEVKPHHFASLYSNAEVCTSPPKGILSSTYPLKGIDVVLIPIPTTLSCIHIPTKGYIRTLNYMYTH